MTVVIVDIGGCSVSLDSLGQEFNSIGLVTTGDLLIDDPGQLIRDD